MIYINKQQRNESGLASMVIVTMIIALLSLITIGFARIMDKEYNQATDRQLTSEASYAAESGMNDARAYLAQQSNNGADPNSLDTSGKCLEDIYATGLPKPFVSNGSISGYYADPTGASNDNTIKYTCVIINTKPQELVKEPLKKNQSLLWKLVPNAALTSLYISWQNAQDSSTFNALGSPPQLPKEPTVTSGDKTGIIEATLYPAQNAGAGDSSSDSQNATAAAASRTYFLYPNSNGNSGQLAPANYTDPNTQGFVTGECNSQNTDPTKTPLPYSQGRVHFCNAQIANLPTPALPPAVTLKAANSDIYSGSSDTISWDAPAAVKCTQSGEWSGNLTSSTNPKAQSGSQSVGPLTQGGAYGSKSTHSYSLQCFNGAGASTVVTVKVIVHSTAKYSTTINGDAALTPPDSCTPFNDPFYTNPGCFQIGNGVASFGNYEATYGLTGIPGGGYNLTLNYNNLANPGASTDCISGYTHSVNYYINGAFQQTLHLSCSGANSIALGAVSAGNTVSFYWTNNADTQWPTFDPNFQIDSLSLAGTSSETLPSGPYPDSYNPVATTAPAFYYLRLTALYQDLNVSVQGSDFLGNAVRLQEAQAGVDVTGEGNYTLKRLHGVVELTPQEPLPQYTIQSMNTLCKRLRLPKSSSAPSYNDAVIDDNTAAGSNPDGACQR